MFALPVSPPRFSSVNLFLVTASAVTNFLCSSPTVPDPIGSLGYRAFVSLAPPQGEIPRDAP